MAMADLDRRARPVRWCRGDPVHAGRAERGALERLLRSHHDLVIRRLERDDVQGRSGGRVREAQSLALADRETMDALMTAQHATALVHDRTGEGSLGLALR